MFKRLRKWVQDAVPGLAPVPETVDRPAIKDFYIFNFADQLKPVARFMMDAEVIKNANKACLDLENSKGSVIARIFYLHERGVRRFVVTSEVPLGVSTEEALRAKCQPTPVEFKIDKM